MCICYVWMNRFYINDGSTLYESRIALGDHSQFSDSESFCTTRYSNCIQCIALPCLLHFDVTADTRYTNAALLNRV